MIKSGKVLLWVLFLTVAAAAGWLGVSWFMARPLAEARRAYENGDYTIAASLAETRLAQHPSDANAILLAARASAHSGRWDRAEAYFVQVPLHDLDDFHMRASGLVACELLTEAAAVYDQILQRWPLDPDALQSLAAIRGGDQRRFDEALVLAEQLCRIPSHKVVGLVMVAKIRYSLGHLEATVSSFENALAISPDLKELPSNEPVDALLVYSKALLLLGKVEQAEQKGLSAR